MKVTIQFNWVKEKQPEENGEIVVYCFNGFVGYWRVLMWDEELNKWGEYYGDKSDCANFRFWAKLNEHELLEAQS